MNNQIKLNPKFQPLFTSEARYFIVTGGRGSSKSFSISTWLVLLMLFEKGHTILFTRLTMTSANISIIPEFMQKIELLGKSDAFLITKDSIVCRATGSKIIFKGIRTASGDQTASLKSLQGVTTWILDEAEELNDEKLFDKINLSIRTKGIQNRVVLILNPSTKEHWIYERFFESVGVQPSSNITKGDNTYIHTTYLDNIDNLDASFLQEIELIKLNNPIKYSSAILGGWLSKAEGVVYTNWRIGAFNPDDLQTSFGLDFGYSIDPTALSEVAIDKKKKRIYIKEHLYQKNMDTTQIFDVCKSVCGVNMVIADRQEIRLIDELKQRGLNIEKVVKGDDSIRAGVALMQDYELIIEENSINLIKELNNYVYSNKTAKLYIDAHNHILDATRYIVFTLLSGGNGEYWF